MQGTIAVDKQAIEIEYDKLIFEPPEIGCVLYMPGLPGGGSKIYDRSPYANIGTIVGPTWVRTPGGLWALSFDAAVDDYVSLASNLTKALTAVTALFWINPNDKSTTHSLIGDYTSTTDVSMVCQVIDVAATTTWKLGFYTKGEDSAANSLLGTTTTLSYGKWYLWGATWNGARKVVYINGVSDGIVERVDASLESTVTLNTTIGAYQAAANKENVYGIMALTRVFNRALSALEIQNHFNREKYLFNVW